MSEPSSPNFCAYEGLSTPSPIENLGELLVMGMNFELSSDDLGLLLSSSADGRAADCWPQTPQTSAHNIQRTRVRDVLSMADMCLTDELTKH